MRVTSKSSGRCLWNATELLLWFDTQNKDRLVIHNPLFSMRQSDYHCLSCYCANFALGCAEDPPEFVDTKRPITIRVPLAERETPDDVLAYFTQLLGTVCCQQYAYAPFLTVCTTHCRVVCVACAE